MNLRNMKRGEDTEQIGVIQWAECNSNRFPELQLLFHIPNGGKRSKSEAAIFKAMGVKAGVPDLCLPVPRGGFAGLYIEMKYDKNKPTKNQREWIANLKAQGYKVETCWSGEAATKVLEEYLQMSPTLLFDLKCAEDIDKSYAEMCKELYELRKLEKSGAEREGFIDKLLERIKEEHWQAEKDMGLSDAYDEANRCGGRMEAYEKAEEIVNQLTEEYALVIMEKLLEAKRNCGETSDCSQCLFGRAENKCYLAELQIVCKKISVNES